MNSSEFPFISVMFAVIMGMGVVYLLMAIATIVRGIGHEIKTYWLHTAWVLFMLLLHFHVWWSLWEFQQVEVWNYFTYLFLLSGPVLLFWSAALIIPEDKKHDKIDLKQYYFQNKSKFFLTLSLAVVWGMLLYPVFFGIMDPVFEWLFLFLVIIVSLIFIKNPILNIILSILAWMLFFTWITSYGFVMAATK